MKRSLFAVALVMALSLAAVAQRAKMPPLSQHRAGDPSAPLPTPQNNPAAIPPALCNPCVFYGGDLNPNNFNAAGMSDENTLLITGGSSTYGEVNIPTGKTASIHGILFNVQASAAFDPMQATYDIRTGVSEGNGGTSIASGTSFAQVQATGRNFLGLNEYTILAQFSPVTLTSGSYWFNVTPMCTNTLDGSCNVFRQFVSNTTGAGLLNAVNPGLQPVNQMFLNSSFFGFTWANWCDSSLGFNSTQCAFLSFGLVGGLQ